MEDKIKKILLGICLDDYEADTYLVILKHGPINVSDIAAKTGIKKPTVYLALQTLIKREMVLTNRKNVKRPLYISNDPKKILDNLNEKVNNFTGIFPELRSIGKQEHSPYVKIHEGLDGMKAIYKEALSIGWREEILVYGTVSPSFDNNAHLILYKQWMNMIKRRHVKMREILDITKENYKYVAKIKKMHNPKHKIRLIPQNFEFLPHKMKLIEADSIIYNNKIAFFSSYNTQLYVIVIDHNHICNIYKDLFEMAWEVANEA